MTDRCVSRQWQTALINLRLSIECVQATADRLPVELCADWDTDRRPDPGALLQRHLATVDDFNVALACVQALYWRHSAG